MKKLTDALTFYHKENGLKFHDFMVLSLIADCIRFVGVFRDVGAEQLVEWFGGSGHRRNPKRL